MRRAVRLGALGLLLLVAAAACRDGGAPTPQPPSPPGTTTVSAPPISSAGGGRSRPPIPTACPAGVETPTVVGGTFCGPPPGPGNGRGEDGVCTGAEAAPPCGPGVEPGRPYEYTLPIRCDGVAIFDGRRWVATLRPAANGGTMHVWMALTPAGDRAGFIGPTGSVGFDSDTGRTPPVCGG